MYQNNSLEFIPTAEGRVLPPGLASTTVAIGSSQTVIASNQFYRYEYHLRDHLGTLRSACRCGERLVEATPTDGYAPQVVQEQHYDPFGLELTGLGSQPGLVASRLKYNGKEEQQGLGWIDYGARMYDPAVPRWLSVDPLSELDFNQSGYMYVSGNPINRIDLFGLTDVDKDGKDDGKTLDVNATVKAKRNNPLNNSVAENWEIAHIRNRRTYGENSPYQKHFSAGGNMAVVIVGVPIAAIGAAEVGVAWSSLSRIQQLRKLSAVRQFYSKPAIISRLSVNLLGQTLGNHLSSGPNKFDLLSLGADVALPGLWSVAAGSVGEYSTDFNSEFKFKQSDPGEIASKLASGAAFGAAGDKVSNWVSPNGGTTFIGTIYDATLEVWHQTFDAIMESNKNKP